MFLERSDRQSPPHTGRDSSGASKNHHGCSWCLSGRNIIHKKRNDISMLRKTALSISDNNDESRLKLYEGDHDKGKGEKKSIPKECTK